MRPIIFNLLFSEWFSLLIKRKIKRRWYYTLIKNNRSSNTDNHTLFSKCLTYTLSLKYAVKKWRIVEKRYFPFMAFQTKWVYGFTSSRKVFFTNASLHVQLTNSALSLSHQNTLKTGLMSKLKIFRLTIRFLFSPFSSRTRQT